MRRNGLIVIGAVLVVGAALFSLRGGESDVRPIGGAWDSFMRFLGFRDETAFVLDLWEVESSGAVKQVQKIAVPISQNAPPAKTLPWKPIQATEWNGKVFPLDESRQNITLAPGAIYSYSLSRTSANALLFKVVNAGNRYAFRVAVRWSGNRFGSGMPGFPRAYAATYRLEDIEEALAQFEGTHIDLSRAPPAPPRFVWPERSRPSAPPVGPSTLPPAGPIPSVPTAIPSTPPPAPLPPLPLDPGFIPVTPGVSISVSVDLLEHLVIFRVRFGF